MSREGEGIFEHEIDALAGDPDTPGILIKIRPAFVSFPLPPSAVSASFPTFLLSRFIPG